MQLTIPNPRAALAGRDIIWVATRHHNVAFAFALSHSASHQVTGPTMDNTQLIRVTIRESESNKEEVSPLHLVVNRSQTVGETKKMLIDRDSSLAVDELMFDGEGVEDNRLLSSFPSSEKSSLLFTARRRTLEVRTARRKPRCSHKNCNSTPLRGVGDCRNCNGKFCSRHRLMEQHDCAGLQGCKQQLHERNAMRLQQQQTMPNKV